MTIPEESIQRSLILRHHLVASTGTKAPRTAVQRALAIVLDGGHQIELLAQGPLPCDGADNLLITLMHWSRTSRPT